MNNIYLYFHINPIKQEVFYIGIGKNGRSYNKYSRSVFWRNIVKKYGYDIIIIHDDLTKEEACQLEIKYIAQIGRRDKCLGTLVNQTDGGDGIKNYKHSKKTKKILSIKNKKRFEDPKEREKISIGLKNSEDYRLAINKPEYRKKLSESKLDANSKFQKTMKSKKFSKTMSKAMTGENNHMFGRTGENNPRFGRGRVVYQYNIHNSLIKEWPNANIASSDLGIDRVTIERRCKNNSTKPYNNSIWTYNKI